MFTEEESGAVYKLVYELDKEHSQRLDVLNTKDAYLYFSDFQKRIKIRRGEHICRVILIFNTEWLEKNHPNAGAKIKQLLTTLLHKNQTTSIPEELDRKNYYLLKQLVERMNHSSFSPLIPGKMNGHTAQIWIGFLSHDEKDAANSVYAGKMEL